jgi:LysM repeat protein
MANKNLSGLVRLVSICILALFVSSCAGTKASRTNLPHGVKMVYEPGGGTAAGSKQVYHTVAPGETLWRIAQMYNVDIEKIKKANRINNVQDVDIGRKLYIPGASPRKNVVTLYPSSKWKYIIIHHSGTDMGNSQQFYVAHKKKGWETVGYHFVIDNGSCGKDAGQIETTPRWIKQMNGAHCKASNMNEKAIGVCLVGNYSQDRLSGKQMDSIVFLVNELRRFYRIPNANIMGHSSVPGAATECPGKKFPWTEFWTRLGR